MYVGQPSSLFTVPFSPCLYRNASRPDHWKRGSVIDNCSLVVSFSSRCFVECSFDNLIYLHLMLPHQALEVPKVVMLVQAKCLQSREP